MPAWDELLDWVQLHPWGLVFAALGFVAAAMLTRRRKVGSVKAVVTEPARPQNGEKPHEVEALKERNRRLLWAGRLRTLPALLADESAALWRRDDLHRLAACLRPRSGADFRSPNEREALFKKLDGYSARAETTLRDSLPNGLDFAYALSGASDLIVVAAWPPPAWNTDQEGMAESLVNRLYDLYVSREGCVSALASAGWVYRAPSSGATLRQMVACAEIACRVHRGVVAFDEKRRSDEYLDADMREALDSSFEKGGFPGFQLYYQPKFSLTRTRTGLQAWTMNGVEALARFIHPASGSQCPLPGLLAYLRDRGQTQLFNDWLFKQAAQDGDRINKAVGKHEEHLDVVCSINVVPSDFTPEFVRRCDGYCRSVRIERRKMEFELLEAGDLPDECLEAAKIAQNCSFRISLDDFGTERSNLDRFDALDLDRGGTVKLDRQIVLKALAKKGNFHREQLKALTSVWTSHKYAVVAEGVPDSDDPPPTRRSAGIDLTDRFGGDEALDILVGLGIKCIQGFVFCRPLPIDRLLERAKDASFVVAPAKPTISLSGLG